MHSLKTILYWSASMLMVSASSWAAGDRTHQEATVTQNSDAIYTTSSGPALPESRSTEPASGLTVASDTDTSNAPNQSHAQKENSNSSAAVTYGEWIFPKGKSTDISNYEKIFIGALWDDRKDFSRFVNVEDMPGYYIIPSIKRSRDVRRLIRTKYLGWTDPFAKEVAQALEHVEKPITIYALSQGSIVIVNAVRYRGLSNRHKFVLFSPAMSYPVARLGIPKKNLEYHMPWVDASNVWAPSCNPIKILSGIPDLLCGFCRHWDRNIWYHFSRYRQRKNEESPVRAISD